MVSCPVFLRFQPTSRTWGILLFLCMGSLGVLGWLGMQRDNDPLYCIAKPDTVWNGLTALPTGWTPTCPVSWSYRQEIRQGSSHVEQYRLGGWQPLAARDLLGQAGYTLVEDELLMPTHYSAFLGRVAPAELHLTAVQDGPDTLVTISGAQ